MVRLLKKIFLSLMIVCLTLLTISLNVRADASGSVTLLHELEATSNFFTQVEDTRTVEITDKTDSLLANGYNKTIENNDLAVYYKSSTCGIAVVDKVSGYTWYSGYNNVARQRPLERRLSPVSQLSIMLWIRKVIFNQKNYLIELFLIITVLVLAR